jgi:hypothetical protein
VRRAVELDRGACAHRYAHPLNQGRRFIRCQEDHLSAEQQDVAADRPMSMLSQEKFRKVSCNRHCPQW